MLLIMMKIPLPVVAWIFDNNNYIIQKHIHYIVILFFETIIDQIV